MNPSTTVSLGDSAYPPQLAHIPSPPPRLWIRGDSGRLPGPAARALAVVGSRSATREGLQLAYDIASGLARRGVTIVSGLARGVDSAAHRAALDHGGLTIAVLGSGLGCIYPKEHGDLASRIAETGAIVSEWPDACPPRKGFFPLRNRIISGLAAAVVVVEAPERSGSLITASAAADQGKDVLVVPGRVSGGRNRGGHLLIRDGAKLVESADDILDEMGWAATSSSFGISPEVIEFTVDDAAADAGITPAEALARLLELELTGEIQRVGFGRFIRRPTRVLT
jgi:DNA processing protein